MEITPQALTYLFGEESTGQTPEDRAKTSTRKFIRSQDHLSIYSEERHSNAKGRVLTAFEALKNFGMEILEEAIEKGSAIIVHDIEEPGKTLKDRRNELGLEIEDLVKYSVLRAEDIKRAEDSNTRSSIRDLEKLCQILGLDESVISFNPGAYGDRDLAIRLKTLLKEESVKIPFNPSTVLVFDEAGWVIRTQSKLWKWTFNSRTNPKWKDFNKDDNFGKPGYPSYEVGYQLAIKTREILGIDKESPIRSLRELCDKTLDIPLLQAELPARIAGATIVNGGERGIIANQKGNNENVWTRRFTIAHELGHLLWDPDESLNKIQVDDYEIHNKDFELPQEQYIEQRANAFAIEFLAPRTAVKKKYKETENLRDIMETFGISYSASRFHAWNSFERRIQFENLQVDNWDPTDEWKVAENFASDYFPVKNVPLIKTGYFAGLVAKAEKMGLITEDTASQYLSCGIKEYRENKKDIYEIYFDSE